MHNIVALNLRKKKWRKREDIRLNIRENFCNVFRSKVYFRKTKDKSAKIPFIVNENISTLLFLLKVSIRLHEYLFLRPEFKIVKFMAFNKMEIQTFGIITSNQTYSNQVFPW